MAEKLRKELTQAVDDDAAAFDAVMGSYKLPKETEEQETARKAAIINATLNAAHVPLHVAEDVVKVMELAVKCAQDGNVNAISDAMTAFAMSRAALTAAAQNVQVNINSLEEKTAGERMLNLLQDLEEKASQLEKEVRQSMAERVGK